VTAAYDERPLRVDWVEAATLADGRSGRLGLTFLPGKHGASFRYPGRVYRRDLDEDLRALADAGVRVLVLLVEDHELVRWGNAAIVELAVELGVRVERRPMVDGTAPTTTAEMRNIIASINRARDSGDVAVACMGGVGRTGTVVACALVSAGMTAAGAIAEVRRVRHPMAVETAEQLAFVEAYAQQP
jgi:ADP-ribosyl-[dinitrogen reductase] hydrolase